MIVVRGQSLKEQVRNNRGRISLLQESWAFPKRHIRGGKRCRNVLARNVNLSQDDDIGMKYMCLDAAIRKYLNTIEWTNTQFDNE